MADVFVAGLRFLRSDAKKLTELADFFASTGSDPGQVGLFRRAAEDAADGEPFRVFASSLDEVQMYADIFVRAGIPRPAVEALGSPQA